MYLLITVNLDFLSFLLQLSRFLVSESKMYSDINITKLDVSEKKVSFTFCVKIGTGAKIESDTKRHLQQLLNATEVEINILGTSP